MIKWEINARELANCNCAYGCPCQFNALPTYGFCEAVVCMGIDHGFYGDVDLAGVRFACIVQWPGAVHEGKGKCQPVVDIRANIAQREAILKIASGADTDPGKTIFNVFASTYEHVYEPIFTEIDFAVDIESRTGTIDAKDTFKVSGKPIINPITGLEHRVRIDIPDGFEYSLAEIGSASSQTFGHIQLDLKESYGQFAYIRLNNHGVIKD